MRESKMEWNQWRSRPHPLHLALGHFCIHFNANKPLLVHIAIIIPVLLFSVSTVSSPLSVHNTFIFVIF